MSRFDTYNRINSMVPSKGRPSLLVLLGSIRLGNRSIYIVLEHWTVSGVPLVSARAARAASGL